MKKELTRHLEAFTENAVDFICQQELVEKLTDSLSQGRPLKLKIGFDPTAKDIHLGHTVLLRKLRKLQDLGHFVYFIIGDFTAKIGDPSGRTALRPVLSDQEILENARTYTTQAFRILDKSKTEIVYNSKWYKNMNLASFLSLLSSYTVARVLERDDFSKRIKENKPLSMLEIIYPLIQGYDSVMLKADVEFGGTDQKFNLIVGRHLQQTFEQKSQSIITMPLLVGLDGVNKMSKSLGNYIGITDTAKDIFGKIMSVSDEVMWEYFRLLTEHNLEEVKKLHPKEAKILLAHTMVSYYYSASVADKEREEFNRIFSENKVPQDVVIYKAKTTDVDLVAVLYQTEIVASKNEVRRLLKQGAISLVASQNGENSVVILEPILKIAGQEIVLKIGKKRFLKITI